MIQKITTIILFSICVKAIWFSGIFISNIKAQNVFDLGATQALVNKNKNHYDDNITAKESQAKLAATETLLKTTNEKVTTVFNKLDKKLTSVYIVLGDLKTMYDIAMLMKKMGEDQAKALQLLQKTPLLIAYYVPMQKKIYEQAEDLYKLIALIVMSYGDINKIEAAKRAVIFNSIKMQIGHLYDRNYNMLAMLVQYQKTIKRRDPKIDYYINQDKQKVQQILQRVNL